MKENFVLLTNLLIVFIFIQSCSPKLSEKTIPLDNVLEHVNSVLDELQNQGFTAYKCKFRRNKIWVDVKINNRNAEFLLDTGASFTFLNKKYVDDFNLKTKTSIKETDAPIFTFFGELTGFERRLANQFKIAGFNFRPWPMIVHETDQEEGVLGVDFLHFGNAVIIPRFGLLLINITHQAAQNMSDSLKELGYAEFDLTLLKTKEEIKWKEKGKEYVLESGVFVVDIKFDSLKGNVIIDTGAPFTAIYRGYISKSGKKIHSHKNYQFEDAAGNITYAAGALFDTLWVNDYKLATDHYVVAAEDVKIWVATRGYMLPHIGVIGYDLLSRNNAIIDFGNRKLYLQR